jgi:hypothetical protein
MGEVPQDSEDVENHGDGLGIPCPQCVKAVKLLCEQRSWGSFKPRRGCAVVKGSIKLSNAAGMKFFAGKDTNAILDLHWFCIGWVNCVTYYYCRSCACSCQVPRNRNRQALADFRSTVQ